MIAVQTNDGFRTTKAILNRVAAHHIELNYSDHPIFMLYTFMQYLLYLSAMLQLKSVGFVGLGFKVIFEIEEYVYAKYQTI